MSKAAIRLVKADSPPTNGWPEVNAQARTSNRLQHLLGTGILLTAALAAVGPLSVVAPAATVNAIYNSATDVPVTANGYTATGNAVDFSLNYAPATGTDLMVVSNTALAFINGTFENLTNGQPVMLSYGGITYSFVANYYGGSGNDLVLVWASNRPSAWGNNRNGQLGDGTTTDRHMPVPVTATGVLAGKTVVIAVASGHCLGLCSDGTLTAWGDNHYGELGDNQVSGYRSLVPVAVNTTAGVSALCGKMVVAIAAGGVSLGGHSLALCSDGSVMAWGANNYGQLGDNTTMGQPVPVAVNTNSGVSALYGKKVVAIAAGGGHSLALCSDGTLAAWGYNAYGQLGDGTTTQRKAPVLVNMSSGSVHSLALCSDGCVVAWGDNVDGQIGDNTTTTREAPTAVNTNLGLSALFGKTVVAVAAGWGYSLALCSDGALTAWGNNEVGQLGDNRRTEALSLVPVAVNTNFGVSVLYGKKVVAIAAGDAHCLALCSDRTLAAWGWNSDGQLGDSTTTTRYAPVAVKTTPIAASQRFTRVFSGANDDHAVALVAAPPAFPINLTGPQPPTNSPFQFAFTNTPGAFFGVVATMNPTLPCSNWTCVTGLTEVTPGQFQFTDLQGTNNSQRYYRVRSP